ncbi:MAG: FkbM family methyltransferase [Lachnospiraceae bacterium]|nr:FkbM family methyltransferase [Lachnospiraceae bacterium]
MEEKRIREIYSLLGDNISKDIFGDRILYSLTQDTKYIRNMVCSIKIGKEIYQQIKDSPKKKIIFGAGSVGKRLVRIYNDVVFECFVDNHCAGQRYQGYPIIDICELKEKYPEELIIISTNQYHKEILQQLLEEGFQEENIVNIGKEYKKLNDLQYFDLPQLEEKRKEKEIFVDGGCFDGSTSLGFIDWCKKVNRGGYLYAWEPDPNNQEKCRKALENKEIAYQMIPKGLWSEYAEMSFKSNGGSSSITEDGDVHIIADCIDRCIDAPVTFIKMDIEGAEYQAILGAKNIINKYKPKLAICVYHKPEDIWELPWLIHKINPEYKFYLRHYSFGDVETVLYAL